ncbi:hypothetical protein FD29_GL000156 [Companilactobacillus mindensis DSM 14500]|uniref:tRNA(Met) cytidine acetate ligase n=1 Tax=Companilactobacillus mindensis DSM 14500 TaxID=1423770 RepID=A0A0R1QH45_9LACO|nr:nucleotidyltransferase [Companilactobacillus mindensis]KRL44182.1 hypothetical protein FD29_GL000156 [Companilactobacillus mindensis DSM 14500]GEO78666.1 UPF0348 protein [Companilactobacillus mindensis]
MTGVYGFVAEFNPFHNGHKLFIEQIKQKYHPDVLIAVMSGNYVQRGDIAILDKWDRAQLAVDSGVDLVVELPLAYAVEPAELFAKGAISLLHDLGVETLVFGTEQQVDFIEIAKKILQADKTFQQDYRQNSATNLTDFYHSVGIDITSLPNQLLGLNYVAQIVKHDYAIDVKTIQRMPSDFSATRIRNNLAQNKSVDGLVSEQTRSMLENNRSVTWDDYFMYLKYQLLNSSPEELRTVYQMVEGLENKFQKSLNNSDDFTEFIGQVKSKRYTMARLRRLMIYTLLNVKESEINNVYKNPYLRILGFDRVGQNYMRTLKKKTQLITRVGKKETTTLALEIRADKIFQLVTKQEQNFGKIPYMRGVN